MFNSIDEQMKHDDATAASPATDNEVGRDRVCCSCSVWRTVLFAPSRCLIPKGLRGQSQKRKKTMRRIVAKLVIGVAITAIAMFGADSSLGTWKWNPAKSKITGNYPVKSRTEVWEATPDGGVKVTRTQQDADGTTINFAYTYKYDGKEYPVTGGPFDTISAKRVDANTTSFEVVKKTDGTYHQTGRNVISKDGKTRTLTAKGTDAAGKPIVATVVFDKQ